MYIVQMHVNIAQRRINKDRRIVFNNKLNIFSICSCTSTCRDTQVDELYI